MNSHVGYRAYLHEVKLNQLYNSRGKLVTIDDSYNDRTVNGILAKANENILNSYYPKASDVISGNLY